jgi:hypothetical protein
MSSGGPGDAERVGARGVVDDRGGVGADGD